MPDIFPGRNEVAETLIVAQTDSHGDDTVQTMRTELGEGNAFRRKVTYGAKEDPGTLPTRIRAARHDGHTQALEA